MENEVLGDFQIIRLIGQGPLGKVCLGEHRFIRKKYAIKILPEELSNDADFMARFNEIIEMIASLDHLNLAKIHNISSDKGVFFIVSEFISDAYGESQNLSQFLTTSENRISEVIVLSILKQVAYGLDYLHARSITHGSVKLNNILVGKAKEEMPHVFLSDIGLNQIIGQGKILSKAFNAVAESLEIDPRVTGLEGEKIYASEEADSGKIGKLHRSFLQTYKFLAPEQKGGSNSPKSDVYAFGVLAYFLLMGYLPEGSFLYPSQSDAYFAYNWDILIESTLRQNPEDRPESLIELLGQVSGKELREVEPTIAKYAPQLKAKVSRSEPQPSAPMPISKYDMEEPSKPSNAYTRVRPIPQRNEAHEAMEKKYESESATAVATDAPEMGKKPVLNPSKLEKHEYEENPGAIFEAPKVVKPYKPTKSTAEEIEPLFSEMVMINGGEYMRGSNIGARDEKPRQKIVVDPFAIDIHPVTNEQFMRLLHVMGGEKDSNNNDMIQLKESRIKRNAGKLSIESGYAKHPVVGVSWYGSIAYAEWVGKRLPTEAEWEVAATCGIEKNIYPYGAHIERTESNFFSADTTSVMSYPPNKSGLYDIVGNVYEWCQDWYSYNFYEHALHEPNNPKGPQQGVYRVLRGGCWKSLEEDMRCSHRHRNNPGTMNRTYGFRLAANVE